MARKSVPVDTIESDSTTSVTPISDNTVSGANNDAANTESELVNGFESVNPGDTGNGSDSGGTAGSGTATGTRRRGRPPGSTNAPRKTKTNLGGLESILLSLHAMASGFLEVPELALDPDEAKLMADAAAQVAAHYNHVMNPKVLAWANLAMVCGGVYGTRYAAVRMRLKAEAANRAALVKQAAPGNVREMKSGTNAAPGLPDYSAYAFRPDNTPLAAE